MSHTERINRVLDYIQSHLESNLSLKVLSNVACFSEFHFTRVFKSVMGEPVYQYVRRLRLEKSADLLLAHPLKSITEIALMSRFSTPSSFAKSFKSHFGMSATKWRNRAQSIFEKQCPKNPMEHGKVSFINGSPVWTFQKERSIRQVVIENIPPLKIAYVRNVGPYKGDVMLFEQLYAQLFRWAVPREKMGDDTFTLNIYHDNPKITDKQKLRVMAAIPVHGTVAPTPSVGITKISGGKYGVCRFLLKSDEFENAWDWMISVWLKSSGYAWDQREAFERCIGEKTIRGIRHFEVDICIPVKPKIE